MLTPRRAAALIAAILATPASAATVAPGRSLQSAVDHAPPGTAFLIRRGLHRLQSVVPKDGDSFWAGFRAAGQEATGGSGDRAASARLPTSRSAASRPRSDPLCRRVFGGGGRGGRRGCLGGSWPAGLRPGPPSRTG